MKSLITFILCIIFISCQNTSNLNQAAVAPGHKLVYISSDIFEKIKSQINPFPQPGSSAQSIDEFALRKFQKSRTERDCERARSEVIVSLQNFYGKPFGPLESKQIETLEPFIDQIRADAGFYIGQVKRNFNRTRPYEYLKDLKPCVDLEKSLSYPSGHATLAVLYALVLGDILPDKSQVLHERSQVIAQDRVLAGVHHPSDIAAGKKLGQVLYNEISQSTRYKSDTEQLKKILN